MFPSLFTPGIPVLRRDEQLYLLRKRQEIANAYHGQEEITPINYIFQQIPKKVSHRIKDTKPLPFSGHLVPQPCPGLPSAVTPRNSALFCTNSRHPGAPRETLTDTHTAAAAPGLAPPSLADPHLSSQVFQLPLRWCYPWRLMTEPCSRRGQPRWGLVPSVQDTTQNQVSGLELAR